MHLEVRSERYLNSFRFLSLYDISTTFPQSYIFNLAGSQMHKRTDKNLAQRQNIYGDNSTELKLIVTYQRQHLSAVKNRKLCGAALAQKGELCGRVRRKLSNYAAKLRRISTKSAVIVRHFQLIFGSN